MRFKRLAWTALLVCLFNLAGCKPLTPSEGEPYVTAFPSSPGFDEKEGGQEEGQEEGSELSVETAALMTEPPLTEAENPSVAEPVTGTVGEDAAEPEIMPPSVVGQPDVPVSTYGMQPHFLVDPLLPPLHPDSRWRVLDEVVRRQAAATGGRISVVAIDLTYGGRYEFRPNDLYYPASTYKLPVVLCTLEAIDRGELTWNTLVEYTPADYDPVGGGQFYQSHFGERFPVHNLVSRMIISSNNIATLMMSRTLGLDEILDCTTAMGGPVTRDENGSTPVTARDVAAWWLRFWQRYREKPETISQVVEWFRRVDFRGRIMAGTPLPNSQILHKFGSYAQNEHDGALVLGDRPYILVVLTHGGVGSEWAIQEIARAAYEAIYTFEPLWTTLGGSLAAE